MNTRIPFKMLFQLKSKRHDSNGLFLYFQPEKEHCLMYTRACIESLAHHLSYLGRLVSSSTQWAHPVRGPLSLHLPLSRHAACFLSLSVFTHHVKLKSLMEPFLHPNPNVLRRLMEELANVLVMHCLCFSFSFRHTSRWSLVYFYSRIKSCFVSRS